MSDSENLASTTSVAEAAAPTAPGSSEEEKSNRTVTHVAYGLMAWGALGMFDQTTVPTIFAFGSITLPFIIAGILVHIKRDESREYWFANHYQWMVRTFWFSVLWQLLHFSYSINYFTLSTALIGALWSVYRVVRGWLYLTQHKPIPNYG